MIIADTSGLLAFFNRSEPHHVDVRHVVETQARPLIVSPYVIAELDYLVATRLGIQAEVAVLDELAGGAYVLAGFDPADLAAATAIVREYPDLGIGIADASIVVLSDRYRTRDILTLDRRHFSVLRNAAGEPLRVIP